MKRVRFISKIVVAVIALAGCTSRERTYRVVLQSLPEMIDPQSNLINIYHYINMHLFYPLFERKDDGSLGSEYLDIKASRAFDQSFKRFQLCLKKGAAFSEGEPIAGNDLRQSLEDAHGQDPLLTKLDDLVVKDDCVIVSLAERNPQYFDQLTSIRSAIIRLGDRKEKFPMGLGPYRVQGISEERILLVANRGRVQGSFSAIEFIKAPKNLSEFRQQVDDFNHLYRADIPKTWRDGYQKIQRPLFKTYFLLVKIRNPAHRRIFTRCFPGKKFVDDLRLSLEPTQGFLPNGVPGTGVNFENLMVRPGEAACQKRVAAVTIAYYNYTSDEEKPALDFFAKHAGTLPLGVNVRTVSLEDTIKAAFGADEMSTLR